MLLLDKNFLVKFWRVYVIEFQKRGLPHIHMLITLKQNCKILNSEIVDKFISAKIPNPNENENLHNIVTTYDTWTMWKLVYSK